MTRIMIRSGPPRLNKVARVFIRSNLQLAPAGGSCKEHYLSRTTGYSSRMSSNRSTRQPFLSFAPKAGLLLLTTPPALDTDQRKPILGVGTGPDGGGGTPDS